MAVPTLYEWAGGAEALERLTERFYVKVKADPLLEPLFAAMPADHPHHVALWLGEVFRGPEAYSAGVRRLSPDDAAPPGQAHPA